jgi:hypothetical protein
MRIVAVAAGASMLSHFGGILMEAIARLRVKLALNIFQICVFALLLLFLSRHGLAGYAVAFASAQVLLLVVQTCDVVKITHLDWSDLLRVYRPGMLAGVASWALLYAESGAGRAIGAPAGLVLALQVLSGCAVLCLGGLLVDGGRLYGAMRPLLLESKSSILLRVVGVADSVAMKQRPRSS